MGLAALVGLVALVGLAPHAARWIRRRRTYEAERPSPDERSQTDEARSAESQEGVAGARLLSASGHSFLRGNGGDVAYRVAGHGPVVIAIQGVGVIGNGWRPQVDELARHFRIVTFDNRGIGRSAPGTQPLSIEEMARDVVALMDAVGADCAHIIGHSMGGLIALHVALTVPGRVKSLSLLCTFANGADPGRPSLRMMLHGLRARVGTRAMRREGMMRMIMPAAYLRSVDRPRLAEKLAELFGRDLADQPPIVSRQLEAMSKYSCVERLHEIRGIPTLVVSATHDPIAPPRLGKAVAEGIAGARFVGFPHASHALPIQCPDGVNALLLDHLTSTETTAVLMNVLHGGF